MVLICVSLFYQFVYNEFIVSKFLCRPILFWGQNMLDLPVFFSSWIKAKMFSYTFFSYQNKLCQIKFSFNFFLNFATSVIDINVMTLMAIIKVVLGKTHSLVHPCPLPPPPPPPPPNYAESCRVILICILQYFRISALVAVSHR